MPWRSRHISGRELSVKFSDVEPLETHRTVELEASILHLALDRKLDNINKFERAFDSNIILREAINAKKSRNKKKCY